MRFEALTNTSADHTESGKGMPTGRAATTPTQRLDATTIGRGREGTGRETPKAEQWEADQQTNNNIDR